MQLAINYSHPAARLIDQGKIQVDYFKVPNWDWMIKEAKQLRPVAVLFSLEAGNGTIHGCWLLNMGVSESLSNGVVFHR
jgi:hypothetical protein